MPMKRKHYLLIILSLQLVFLFFPTAQTWEERQLILIHPFLLSKAGITPQEYVYYLFEHLSVLMLVFMPLIKFRKDFYEDSFLFLFFGLSSIDFIDYLISFNNLSLPLGPLDVTWNIAQFGIFLFMVLLFRK